MRLMSKQNKIKQKIEKQIIPLENESQTLGDVGGGKDKFWGSFEPCFSINHRQL